MSDAEKPDLSVIQGAFGKKDEKVHKTLGEQLRAAAEIVDQFPAGKFAIVYERDGFCSILAQPSCPYRVNMLLDKGKFALLQTTVISEVEDEHK